MKHFLLISGGCIDDTFACRVIDETRPDVLLAADKGMDFFYRNQRKPDYIIGDFDSAKSESLSYFRTQSDIQIRELCPMKDDTDTESAIRFAIEQGATQITLLGATGSRLDHVLGNIELLGIGLKACVPILILDTKNRIRMIDRGITITKHEQYGKYVSLIPYTECVKNLTLEGFKYPLENATLEGFCSLGISNEITKDVAKICFTDGILLVIEAQD